MFNIFHMEKKEDAGIITKPLENIMTCEYNVQFKIAYSLMNEPVGLCLGLEIRILIKNIPMKTTFLFDSMIATVTTFLSPQCIFFLPFSLPDWMATKASMPSITSRALYSTPSRTCSSKTPKTSPITCARSSSRSTRPTARKRPSSSARSPLRRVAPVSAGPAARTCIMRISSLAAAACSPCCASTTTSCS